MIVNSVLKYLISSIFVIFAVTCGLWHIWWLAILLIIAVVLIWTKYIWLLITILFLGVVTLPITFNKISNRMDYLGALIRSESPQALSTTDRVGIYLGNISMAIVGFAIFAPEVAIETLLLMDPRGQDRTFNSSFAMRSSHISEIIDTYTLGVRSGTLPKQSKRIPLKWDEDNRKAYSMDDYRVALAVAGGGLFLNYKRVGKDYEVECRITIDVKYSNSYKLEVFNAHGVRLYIDEAIFTALQELDWFHPYYSHYLWKLTV
ncbi:hypothetical protein N9T57_01615 [Paracoccaceae bacterium]|nr:hypothetical protein [Paracoccaceae bacterium]